MRLLHHTNVLGLHISFVHKSTLWMVEPYVAGGSMLNIMKYAYPEVKWSGVPDALLSRDSTLRTTINASSLCAQWPCMPRNCSTCPRIYTSVACGVQGLEEPVIATILRDVLKGLDYMHKHGNIHRDVKVLLRYNRRPLPILCPVNLTGCDVHQSRLAASQPQPVLPGTPAHRRQVQLPRRLTECSRHHPGAPKQHFAMLKPQLDQGSLKAGGTTP